MLSFLRQPYPIGERSPSKAILQALLFGGSIAFVLVVFQPFGSYGWQHPYKTLILSGYGLMAAFATFINFYLLIKGWPGVFDEARWTIGKEIIWNVLSFLFGALLSTLYGYLVGVMPLSLSQVSFMIPVVFLVGLFPTLILVLVNYAYLTRKYQPIEPRPVPTVSNQQIQGAITLTADNEKDTLSLAVNDFLYIEASDNYCTIFHLAQGKLGKTLLRSSLSRLENQISGPGILRCHRSYMVNLANVSSVTGNAQGYQLHLVGSEAVVPVARSYAKPVKAHFAARHSPQ